MHQGFSGDVGWEGVNNRMICVDCPTKVQDFGWSPTAYSGSEGGEIGGTISNSRYQAYYAMPLGKLLSFKEAFSASGRLAIANLGLRGVGYFGFFNATRHEWRPWSSMAIRIWEEDMEGQLMVDWMAGNWSAGGFDTDIFVPHDGSVHQWTFEYDPDALIDTNWEHPRMKDYLADEEQLEENLLAKAQADAPGLTRQEFRARLEKLRDQGLVGYFQRHGRHRWWQISNPDKYQGRITFLVGDRRPYTVFIEKRIRNSPVEMDRFGIFNIQRYGEGIEMYLSGLVINGAEMDLSQDPHWVGHNNRVSYVEPDFQAMHNCCIIAICDMRGWPYNDGDTISRLIAVIFDHKLIPDYMQSHFSGLRKALDVRKGLRSTLESGVPTLRNNLSGHGGGTEDVPVPEYIAAYTLHLTASNILFLAKANEKMK